jgi:hypothetical protein
VPLLHFARTDLEAVLRPIEGSPLPAARDRSAWGEVRARIGQSALGHFLDLAEEVIDPPLPQLTATLYLDGTRTGQREAYESVLRQRHQRLGKLVLAECLERQERLRVPRWSPPAWRFWQQVDLANGHVRGAQALEDPLSLPSELVSPPHVPIPASWVSRSQSSTTSHRRSCGEAHQHPGFSI